MPAENGFAGFVLPRRLTVFDLETAAAPVRVSFTARARQRAAHARDFVTRCRAEGRAVYGASTGFGPLVGFAGRGEDTDQCENLLSHLTVGQGPDLPPAVVRAALLVRAQSLAHGRSGASMRVLDMLAGVLRTTLAPAVPRLGSLGASGDLVPLAHAVQVLKGRGHAYLDTRRMPAEQALRAAGLEPVELTGRDALALLNGTPLTAAATGLAVAQLTRSHATAVLLTALLADVLGCDAGFASPHLLDAYGHPDAARVGESLRAHLRGLVPSGQRALQEPYSIRCTPQLLGAVAASIRHGRELVGHDLNGVSDNPVFFPEHDLVAHGGNFFGQSLAFVADLIAVVAAQTGNLAERQLDLLVDPHRNGGLPPVLATVPGRQHGVQGVQLAATAVVTEMRRAAVPASVQTLPTNLHNQDVVPLGTHAALTALANAESLRMLHGSLAVALRQAVHVGARVPTAARTAAALDRLVAVIPPVDPDRPLDEDVRIAADELDAMAGDILGVDEAVSHDPSERSAP
ncbi:histidine ammonia-lyase/tyrosine ammonia-lyase [Amycolatopsis arida]|uniref:Histidine ammonia-lyase/tyrosine ammonia-lyase n=1 Tax=Amycolatopsis arida TaxID=587909 RepID=A0A1I6AWM7_9PSEU|nr:aromatic amino acid ammonia-lyase [Amycolatopsis arida]TDX85378.1 histidine ammonia-lyase/tyrosine ammonia-lyase [Amycolatopsis arida]SFQ73100.1 histidine ammonia-lyase/tyrosine ammonia-lyase [Amycolatopsis arida]